MTFDSKSLRELAELTDDDGIISLYVATDPREEAAVHPAWHIRIRNELDKIHERVRACGDERRTLAVQRRLKELEPDIARMLQTDHPARGRALFAAIAGPATYRIELHVPLTNMATLAPLAHLRPLVEAWNSHSPAGIATISERGIRVIELSFGIAREVAEIPYRRTTENWRRLVGPAAANPAHTQHSISQRDLYARRVTDHVLHFLRDCGPEIASIAKSLRWEQLMLTGEAELTRALQDGIPPGFAPTVLIGRHVIESLSPAEIAAAAEPELLDSRRRRDRSLAEHTRDTALAGGPAVCGLDDTLAALGEGRVTHLLLDRSREWEGRRALDGRLAAGEEIPVGSQGFTTEPSLSGRMIQYAYQYGGEVTLLDPTSAEPLEKVAGVAAAMRW